jgi:hypothetical protein
MVWNFETEGSALLLRGQLSSGAVHSSFEALKASD